MNTELFAEKWTEMRGEVKERWSKFNDDDLGQIEGKLDELVSLVQEKYGHNREQATQQVERFLSEYKAKLQDASGNILAQLNQVRKVNWWIAVAVALGLLVFVFFLLKSKGEIDHREGESIS